MSVGSTFSAEDQEAVHLLASVPGISEEQAQALVALGFHDVSQLVRLALPDPDVRRGPSHVIVRRSFLPQELPGAAGLISGDSCPVCGASASSGDERCGTCGFALPDPSPQEAAATDVALDDDPEDMAALESDADVRQMPDAIRDELLALIRGTGTQGLLREQYRRQVDAWRTRGFDVGPIEELLANDLTAFRERSVQLIRTQVLAQATDGGRCPQCHEGLPVAARMCEACGARVG